MHGISSRVPQLQIIPSNYSKMSFPLSKSQLHQRKYINWSLRVLWLVTVSEVTKSCYEQSLGFGFRAESLNVNSANSPTNWNEIRKKNLPKM